MPGLTKRNFLATLIVIAGLAASSLAWIYLPLVIWPLLPLAAALGLAVFLSVYPAAPVTAPAGAGRPPAGGSPAARPPTVRGAAATASPPPGRRSAARDEPPR